MSWNNIIPNVLIMVLAVVPGIAYPYLRDYANQKKRELQEVKNDLVH